MSGSGFSTSGVTFVELRLPELPSGAGVQEVAAALNAAADEKLGEHIKDVKTYNEFTDWAEKVKVAGGTTAAGVSGVLSSPCAWLSFALGTESLIAKTPTEGDIKIENFNPSDTSGKYDFEVSIEDVTIGDGATEENIKKVLGIEGSTALGNDTKPFSADNVCLTLAQPKNGKVKFTVSPADSTAKQFFMKVKMK